MAVIVKILSCKHSEQALDLISSEFSCYSVLHSSQHILPVEYRNYLKSDWHGYAFGKENISLVALDEKSGRVEGCLIAIPFYHEQPDIKSLPEKHQPIASLLYSCLLYTSPSPRDLSTSRMPSSA